MVFSSVIFLFLFLPFVLTFYFPVRNQKRFRNIVLLVSSLFFYFWGEGAHIAILIAYIIVNYLAALLIGALKARDYGKWSRAVLIGAVAFDLSFLVFYKYTGFLVGNLEPVFQGIGLKVAVSPIHLPIGISFFAFQAISYVIDVYRTDVKATKSLLDFAMYKSFFPQLIAGPIVRYRDVSEQVEDHAMKREMFVEGIQRFIAGLAKKVIVANTAAAAADRIFQIPAADVTPVLAWLGILCYSLQIYFDFSGYSDMAIGMGRMFGFKFLENFNYPYIAQSVRDFWRRWHISLSTWFRDYLYIPLGGNRGPAGKVLFNLVLVFFLCGLWHGASWTFVIWGLWHGGFLALERTPWGNWVSKAWMPLRSVYTLAVVAVGWVFFRSENLPYAIKYLSAAFGLAQGSAHQYPVQAYWSNELLAALLLGIVFSAPVAPAMQSAASSFFGWFRNRGIPTAWPERLMETVTFGTYLVVFAFCSLLLASGTHNPFIYFRF
jgi:alginate O-acetyltransferase complex protein AlgI